VGENVSPYPPPDLHADWEIQNHRIDQLAYLRTGGFGRT